MKYVGMYTEYQYTFYIALDVCILLEVSMHIAIVPNRNSPPAILLRESYREQGKVKTRTLVNLSMLPPQAVEVLRRTLKGEELVSAEDAFEIIEGGSRFHGHIAAVLTSMKRLGFFELIASRRRDERDLVVGMRGRADPRAAVQACHAPVVGQHDVAGNTRDR